MSFCRISDSSEIFMHSEVNDQSRPAFILFDSV